MPTILVVEDEPDIRLTVEMSLAGSEFVPTWAPTGEDALSLLERSRPDVVLLDIRLPGMDGWEVLRRMRELDGLDSVPVLVFSAHSGSGTRLRAIEEGCAGIVPKPFRPRELVEAVRKAVDGTQV